MMSTILSSIVDQVFIEVFKLKKKIFTLLSNTNTEEEWDNVMRKVRLAFFKLYFEYVKKKGLTTNG